MRNIGMLGVALFIGLIGVQDAFAKEVNAWALSFGDEQTVPVNTPGELQNTQNGQCLRKYSGPASKVQTDWKFTGCGNKRAKLLRKNASNSGPLLCGEAFALELSWHANKECYFKCPGKQQQLGINICSETCGKDIHYQWELRGCQAGQPVKPGTPLVLWNTAQQDSLVYGQRPSRIADTCWADKELGGKCLSVRDR